MTITVTSTAHGLTDGDVVCIEDVIWDLDVTGAQPDQLNGNCYIVANVTADTYEIELTLAVSELDVSGDFDTSSGGMGGFTFNNNGTRLYVNGRQAPRIPDLTADAIHQYALSTPWDITTAGPSIGAVDVLPDNNGDTSKHAQWNDDGTKMFIMRTGGVSGQRGFIAEHAATVPYDVTSLQDLPTWDGNNRVHTAPEVNLNAELFMPTTLMGGFRFNSDGTRIIFSVGIAFNHSTVKEFPLSTAYDITTAGLVTTTFGSVFTDTGGSNRDIAWSQDGTTFIVSNGLIFGEETKGISQYPVSTPYDLSTAGVLAATWKPGGLFIEWSSDCRKLYTGNTAGIIRQYVLPTGQADCSIITVPPDTTGWLPYDSGGSALEEVTTVTGIDHLEAETVEGLVNGVPFTGRTVTSGSITLQGSKAQVGIPYTHRFKSLKQNAGAPSGEAMGKTKRIGGLTVALLWSSDFEYGDDLLDTMFTSTNPNANVFTGERYLDMDSGWSSDERYVFSGSEPLPWFCLAVMPDILTNDLL